MIKIGTEDDLHKIAHLPLNIQQAVSEDIMILDCNYGKDRNVDEDMGGFVVVCEHGEELNIKNFNQHLLYPEYVQEICSYTKSLYIAGSERNIIIYEKNKGE